MVVVTNFGSSICSIGGDGLGMGYPEERKGEEGISVDNVDRRGGCC